MAEKLLESSELKDIKTIAKELGKNYVLITKVVKRLLNKKILGLRFDQYKMGLERYIVLARINKEYADAEFLANNMPYSEWLRSVALATVPNNLAFLTYFAPKNDNFGIVTDKIKKSKYVDLKYPVQVYKLNTFFPTKPILSQFLDPKTGFTYPPHKGLKIIDKIPISIDDTTNNIKNKDEPKVPNDILDLLIMSFLEVIYTVSPRLLVRGGIFKVAPDKLQYHFENHCKYYSLGAILKRPLYEATMIFKALMLGPDSVKLTYTISKTPYGYGICDESNNYCIIYLMLSERDLPFIYNFLNQFNIDILEQAIILPLAASKRNIIFKSLPYENFSIKGNRWYNLAESGYRYKYNIQRINRKFLKSQNLA